MPLDYQNFPHDTNKISIIRCISETHSICKAIMSNLLKSGTSLGNPDSTKKYFKSHILANWSSLYLILMHF